MAKTQETRPDIELHPDAWGRFRKAIHVMAKAGPQHRVEGAAVKGGPKHKATQQVHGKQKGSRPKGRKKNLKNV